MFPEPEPQEQPSTPGLQERVWAYLEAAEELSRLGRGNKAVCIWLTLARNAQVDDDARAQAVGMLAKMWQVDELEVLMHDAQAGDVVRAGAAKALSTMGWLEPGVEAAFSSSAQRPSGSTKSQGPYEQTRAGLVLPDDSAQPAVGAGGSRPAPGHGICVACQGELGAENICRRCGVDNTRWINWKTAGLENPSFQWRRDWFRTHFGGEVLLLGVALLLAAVIGLGVAVLVGSQLELPLLPLLGFIVIIVATVVSAGSAFDTWSRREAEREAASVRAVAAGIGKRSWLSAPDLPPVVWMLAVGALGSVGGPMLLGVLSVAGLVVLNHPLQLPLTFVATLYIFVLALSGWFWAEAIILPAYFEGANREAPPYIFTLPIKFLELCQREVEQHLSGRETKTIIRWSKIKRPAHGGMELHVTLDAGQQTTLQLLDGKAQKTPIERVYAVNLDRWARIVSLEECHDD